MEKETFTYTYSAKERSEISAIRQKYAPTEESTMDRLRRLDASVTTKANLWSLVVGIVGVLILGFGMSLVMSNIGTMLGLADAMVPGIVLGIIGIGVLSAAYPLYLRIVKTEREKIAPEILRLTDQLLQ